MITVLKVQFTSLFKRLLMKFFMHSSLKTNERQEPDSIIYPKILKSKERNNHLAPLYSTAYVLAKRHRPF